MLEQLRARLRALLNQRQAHQETLDQILATCEAEGRSAFSADEDTKWAETRSAIDTIDAERAPVEERLAELETLATSSAAATAALAAAGAAVAGAPAVVRSEPATYRRDNARDVSFFGDAYRSQRGDFEARERLERHGREMVAAGELPESRDVGTGAFGALVVPQYLTELYAEVARAGRPTANVVRSLPLPDEGMTLNIPRGTTGTATAEQSSENTAVQETDFDETTLQVSVATIAGQQDVSRQSIERGRGTDEIVYADLVADYATKVNAYVLSKASIGLLNQSGVNSVTYTDASPTVTELWPKLADGTQQVNSTRFMPATVAIMHPRRWGWLTAAVDSTGRPLFVSSVAPQNPMGVGVANEYGQVVGTLSNGLPVVTDAGIPTNLGGGTNEDAILIMRADDALLWEEAPTPRRLRFEETLGGSLTVKLVVYGYVAFTAGRYPSSIAKISGTGLATPTF